MLPRAILIILVIALSVTDEALACAGCNIHNYLTESVCSSKNICVGRLVARLPQYRVEVVVERVLRGSLQIGDRFKTEGYTEASDLGRSFVASDPTGGNTRFELLPASYEDEVRFLTRYGYMESFMYPIDVHAPRPRPVITDLDEAIRCCQGYSNESRQIGNEYIAALPTHPIDELLAAFERLEARGAARSYEGSCLIATMMIKPDRRVESLVYEQVRKFLFAPPSSVDWNNLPSWPTIEGNFITNILDVARGECGPWYAGYRPAQKRTHLSIRVNVRELLINMFDDMSEAAIADATFALISTNTLRPEELVPFATTELQRNGMALGLLQVTNEQSMGRSPRKPMPPLEVGLKLATRIELRAELRELQEKQTSAERRQP